MAELKFKTFIGTTVFPLDMLRYDECFPRSQVDVNSIYESIIYEEGAPEIRRQVTVCNRHGFFSIKQWGIFGWKPYEPQELKLVEEEKNPQ